MRRKPNYGLDSPGIMGALFALGLALSVVGYVVLSGWRWVAYGVGGFFLLGAAGMLFYSKVGRLAFVVHEMKKRLTGNG